MTLDTVCWIASMTKAITGTAAMQLVQRGELHLDGPASSVLPNLADAGVLEGVRQRRAAGGASCQGNDHTAPSADPHRRRRPTRITR